MIEFLKRLNPFKKKEDMVVSMQITDELVRFVGVKNSDKGLFIYLFGERYFSPGVVVQGKILNPELMRQTLADLKKTYNLGKVHVVLPEEQSFVFHSMVSKSDGEELQTMIEDHIMSYLKLHTKLPVKDIVCEYDVTGEENDAYEISVWATPRSVVDSYVEVFENAGLDPITLEFGSQVITNVCTEKDGKETSILVDFGNTKTHVSLVTEGVVMHSATIPVGEYSLTPKIREFLNISTPEAEKIKRKYGLLRGHKEPALLSELISEVSPVQDYIDRLYVDWYLQPIASKKSQNPITRLILHGEGSHVVGLRDHMSQATSIPTEYANVWRKIKLPEDRAPEVTFEDSLRYATALSCALHAMGEEE